MKDAFILDVIQCTRQPGNLRITKEACALHYKHAQERLFKRKKGLFFPNIYSSLEVCGKCPKGRGYFEELSEQAGRAKRHYESRNINLCKTTKIKNTEQGEDR